MKKLLSILTLGALITLTGCSKDDGDGDLAIAAKEVNISPSVSGTITQVGFDLWNPARSAGNASASRVPAPEDKLSIRVPFVNNTFRLTLPETVADNYLSSVTNIYPGLAIYGTSAMCVKVDHLMAYDASGDRLGDVFYSMLNPETIITSGAHHNVVYIYVDRDVSISGQKGNDHYDMILKKGWNRYIRITIINDAYYGYSNISRFTEGSLRDFLWWIVSPDL